MGEICIESRTMCSRILYYSGGFRGGSGGSLEPPSVTKLFHFQGGNL